MRYFRRQVLAGTCIATLILGGLALGWGAGPAGAVTKTYVVNTTADLTGVGHCSSGGACGLRQALDQYNANTSGSDVIKFSVGTSATFDLNAGHGRLEVDNGSSVPLTINGAGMSDTVLDGQNAIQVLAIISGGPTSINDLTIQDGAVPNQGAGIYIYPGRSLTLDKVAVSDNATTSSPALGGGIYNAGGTLALKDSTVSGNTAGGSPGDGGGIYNANGTVTLSHSKVTGNTAEEVAGGIYNDGGTLTLDSTTVSYNKAVNAAGILDFTGTATLNTAIVLGNVGTGNGGGISNSGGVMTLNFTAVSGNTAAQGGGLFNAGTTTLVSATVTGNAAPYGGGIEAFSGTLTLSSSNNVSLNQAFNDGGGIYINDLGTVDGSNTSTVASNTAGDLGGGVFNDGGGYNPLGLLVTDNQPDNVYP